MVILIYFNFIHVKRHFQVPNPESECLSAWDLNVCEIFVTLGLN